MHFAWRGWILAVLFAALAGVRWRSQQPLEPWGLALIAVGALYRLYAGRYIPGHSNAVRLAGPDLALGGPYRFGRHPLYLSNLAVIAGLILFANCLSLPAAALFLAAACAHHALLARTEERYLASIRGEAYLGYMRVTSRWFGLPRVPAAGPSASLPASRPGGMALSWARQGPNLGKSAACAFILWFLASAHR